MISLSGRRQLVIAGGKESGLESIFRGVPRGSLLGPLFFFLLVMIDDYNFCISGRTIIYTDENRPSCREERVVSFLLVIKLLTGPTKRLNCGPKQMTSCLMRLKRSRQDLL